MDTKICTKCKVQKSVSDFSKDKAKKDGLFSNCKECRKEYVRLNKDKAGSCCSKEYQRQYQREHGKEYRARPEIQERIKLQNKEKYLKHGPNQKEINSNYYYANHEIIKKQRRERAVERRRTDINHRIKVRLSNRVKDLLKDLNVKKSSSVLNLVGCSVAEFISHIESQFEPQMSWDNYGKYGWNLDHIVPCALFNLVKDEDQYQCFNFSNQAPRWATTEIAQSHGSKRIGNVEKSDKLVDDSYFHLLQNPS